ncbi:MAG: N-acetyl-gamma-glutamyl-phosphate reductase [Brevinematales bacterium]|nr:N-acetyl-gamma-glutamyl-phosphate reductase [Brevinematales bacterium]
MDKIKVGVVGASGYTGAELLKILSKHKYVEISFITSRTLVGEKANKVFPELPHLNITFSDTEKIVKSISKSDVNVMFLTLPHEPAIEITHILNSKGIKVIDLSASYRFKNKDVFETAYKIHHPYPELLAKSVWGLSEVFRNEIKNGEIIANPGCYPTSISLGIYPLVEIKEKINLNDIIIDSKSGISGKGKKVSEDSLFVEHNENFYAYGLPLHRHTPEIEQFVYLKFNQKVNILFVPHVIPMDRGIFSSIYIPAEGVSQKMLEDLYRSYYDNEYFVHLVDGIPQTKWVSNTNNCMISVKYLERNGRIVIFSAIDNLIKGASGQAVQNMNIMMSIDEKEGLV